MNDQIDYIKKECIATKKAMNDLKIHDISDIMDFKEFTILIKKYMDMI